MQFIILALASMAAAVPAILKERAPLDVCPALDSPMCCQLDVDGILDLTCEVPKDTSSVSAFTADCASTGYTAKCCTLPVVSQVLRGSIGMNVVLTVLRNRTVMLFFAATHRWSMSEGVE